MKRIFKYPLQLVNDQMIALRDGFEILSVGIDPQGQLCLWVIVDPEAPERLEGIAIIGTGHPLPAEADKNHFIGSVKDGSFVWHVFAQTPIRTS